MRSPCTELLILRLTPQERELLEGLAEVRRMTVSDLLRELMGLEREEEIRQRARPQLRLVSA
jgi:hypothetical protein